MPYLFKDRMIDCDNYIRNYYIIFKNKQVHLLTWKIFSVYIFH